MEAFTPNKNGSVQDMLTALGFTYADSTEEFVKGAVRIPVRSIIGRDPVSFYEEMKAKEWLKEEPASKTFAETMSETLHRLYGMDLLANRSGSVIFDQRGNKVVTRGFLDDLVYKGKPPCSVQKGVETAEQSFDPPQTLLGYPIKFVDEPSRNVPGGKDEGFNNPNLKLGPWIQVPVPTDSLSPPPKPRSVSVSLEGNTLRVVTNVHVDEISRVVFEVYQQPSSLLYLRPLIAREDLHGWQQCYWQVSLSPGNYEIAVYTVNAAGNESECVPVYVTVPEVKGLPE